MKKINVHLLVLLLCCCTCTVSAQNIVKAEYWINSDPGMGLATDIPGITPALNVTNLVFSVPATISPGVHTLGLRSKDSNNRWSHTNMFPVLVLSPPSNSIIDSVEYFINTDAGFRNGTKVLGITPQQTIANLALTVPASLTTGIHTIGVRSRDTDGNWSHTNFYPVLISDTASAGVIVAIEYFWDVDTGFYQNLSYTPSVIVSDLNNVLMNINVPFNLPLGQHNVFVRSRDSRGKWSHTNYALGVDVISGLEDLDQSNVTIYPNPCIDQFNISLLNNQKIRVILYNESGQLILDKSIEHSEQINTSQFAPGTYTVFIWAEQNKIYKTTLLKAR